MLILVMFIIKKYIHSTKYNKKTLSFQCAELQIKEVIKHSLKILEDLNYSKGVYKNSDLILTP